MEGMNNLQFSNAFIEFVRVANRFFFDGFCYRH